MIRFNGYYVPMLEPQDLLNFADEYGIYINADTTHFAETGTEITEAAKIIKDRARTVHLSDYLDGKSHVFAGEGNLDLKSFIHNLDLPAVHSITIECNIEYYEDKPEKTAERLRQAMDYVEACL